MCIGTVRGQCLCKFDIPGCSMLAANKTGNEIVPHADLNASFLRQPNDQGKLLSKGGPTKTWKLNFFLE